jgi:hypothetical protein
MYSIRTESVSDVGAATMFAEGGEESDVDVEFTDADLDAADGCDICLAT